MPHNHLDALGILLSQRWGEAIEAFERLLEMDEACTTLWLINMTPYAWWPKLNGCASVRRTEQAPNAIAAQRNVVHTGET